MGCCKSNAKREVCSNTRLLQETRKTANKQSHLTPTATIKRRTKIPKVSRRKEITKIRAEINKKEMKVIIANIKLLIFSYKEYIESDFSIDHLLKSMCRVVSCIIGRVFAMTGAFSSKYCQQLPCFTLYPKAKLPSYSRYLLTSYFCIPVPYDEKDICFCCQFQKILQRWAQ